MVSLPIYHSQLLLSLYVSVIIGNNNKSVVYVENIQPVSCVPRFSVTVKFKNYFLKKSTPSFPQTTRFHWTCSLISMTWCAQFEGVHKLFFCKRLRRKIHWVAFVLYWKNKIKILMWVRSSFSEKFINKKLVKLRLEF